MIKTKKPFEDMQHSFTSNNKTYILRGGILYDDEFTEIFDLSWTWVSDLTDIALIEKICWLIIHVSKTHFLAGKEKGKAELRQDFLRLLGKEIQ